MHRSVQARDRAPVGHDPAPIAPVALQRLVQQRLVVTRVGPVDPVVGAHDRPGLAAFYGHLEREEVGLPHGRLGNLGVGGMTQRLLVVQGEVLEGGDHVPGLHAPDRLAGQGPGQQRVFAEVFEIPAVARIARQVGAWAEQDIEALAPGLAADHPAGLIGEVRIEARRQGQAGRQGRAPVLGPHVRGIGDPETGVALLQRRHAKAGRAGDIASRPERSGRHGPEEGHGHGPVQHPLLLLGGHLLLHKPRPLVGVELRIHPGRRWLGPRGCGGQCRQRGERRRHCLVREPAAHQTLQQSRPPPGPGSGG